MCIIRSFSYLKPSFPYCNCLKILILLSYGNVSKIAKKQCRPQLLDSYFRRTLIRVCSAFCSWLKLLQICKYLRTVSNPSYFHNFSRKGKNEKKKDCRNLFCFAACELGKVIVWSWKSGFDILARARLNEEQNTFSPGSPSEYGNS